MVPSAKELMLLGEPYLANDPALLLERKPCRLVCERYNATSFGDAATRRGILDELLGEVGADAEVMSPFECDYGYHITIGARSFINYGAVILDGAKVTVGQDVQIGPGRQHRRRHRRRRRQRGHEGPAASPPVLRQSVPGDP
jgi:maltose O-acetyltransferase